MNTKIVNIYPKYPITTVNPPIRTAVKKVTKSIDEIRKCIIARAVVEEILNNGNTIPLDFSNYDKDNNEVIIKSEPVIETPITVEEVVENTIAVETEQDAVESEAKNIEELTPEQKEVYDKAYNEALEGKDLDHMARKERRSVIRAAKLAGNKAVSEMPVTEPEVQETEPEVVSIVDEEATVETDNIENLE